MTLPVRAIHLNGVYHLVSKENSLPPRLRTLLYATDDHGGIWKIRDIINKKAANPR